MTRPLNYTTKIPARRTAGECVDLLADAGADQVSLTMSGREPAGLTFSLRTPNGLREFRLPVHVEAMHKRLTRARRDGEFASLHATIVTLNRLTSPGHAADVAWRVCRDWLESSIALVLAEMATLDEAFTAYRVIDGGEFAGRTVYEAITESEIRALPGGAP